MQVRTAAPDTVVVGGGITGLAAATLIARAGGRVTLFERASSIGGRAITRDERGFRLNLGPHALYRGGAGRRILDQLGLVLTGGVPAPSGGHAVADGIAHTLPVGPVSLLTSGLLPVGAKLELARLMGAIGRIDPHPLARVTVRDWLAQTIRHPRVRALLEALIRLATYTNAPGHMSAAAAVRQLQLALAKNVTYLDGGWQTIVDGLGAAAEQAGVRIVAGARVVALDLDGARGVCLADGTRQPATAIVLALAPDEAAALVPGAAGAALHAFAAAAMPVRAACLDVGLARLPRPRSTFALGIDRPLYLSVHSAFARLAAPGQAVIHVAKYLAPDAPADPRGDEGELEALLDLVQPGWREAVVVRRFLPRLTVMPALATAAAGGLAGRPDAVLPGLAGVFLAGDWVGPEGLLADASLASAARAARLALGAAPLAVAAA